MTQSRNFLALLQDLAAPLANLIAGVTSLSAGSLNNVCKLISCNVCNRLGDSNELFVYDAAILASNNSKAIAVAGRSNKNHVVPCMLGRSNYLNNSAANIISANTGILNNSLNRSSDVFVIYIEQLVAVFASTLINADVLYTILLAGCGDICNSLEIMAKSLNFLCRSHDFPYAYIFASGRILVIVYEDGHFGSVANLFAGSRNCFLGDLSIADLVVFYAVEAIVRNYDAAVGLIALCAVNSVGNTVILFVVLVDAGEIASLENLHCCLMGNIQVINGFALLKGINVIADRAELVASVASAVLKSASLIVNGHIIFIVYKRGGTIAVLIKCNAQNDHLLVNRYSLNVGSCLCCLCKDSLAVLIKNVCCNYNTVFVFNSSEHCHGISNKLSILQLILAVSDKKICCIICVTDELGIAATCANCIAPTIFLVFAYRCINNSELIVVLKSSSALSSNAHVLTAGGAVSNTQADLVASCLLNFNSYRSLANFTLLFVLCKSSNVARNNLATICAHLSFYARLLCSCVLFDADSLNIRMIAICICCQSGSRNQRCDHENSHQHAQQSLFYFLLFTSVKIVG